MGIVGVKGDDTTFDTGSNDITISDNRNNAAAAGGYGTVPSKQKVKIKDLLLNPPVYHEDDITGLMV